MSGWGKIDWIGRDFYGGRINKTGLFSGIFTKIERQKAILRTITIVAKHLLIAYHVLDSVLNALQASSHFYVYLLFTLYVQVLYVN